MQINFKEMDMPTRWLLVSVVHALAAMLLSMYIFSIPFKMALLIALAVYLGMWYLYPLRFYRRTFAAMLGIWTSFIIAGSLKLEFESTILDGLTKFMIELQGEWISHVCWTVLMLALLGLDYLSRKPQLRAAENARRTRGIEIPSLSRKPPKRSVILFSIFILAILLSVYFSIF